MEASFLHEPESCQKSPKKRMSYRPRLTLAYKRVASFSRTSEHVTFPPCVTVSVYFVSRSDGANRKLAVSMISRISLKRRSLPGSSLRPGPPASCSLYLCSRAPLPNFSGLPVLVRLRLVGIFRETQKWTINVDRNIPRL
jgi:hypothetical protein